MVRPGEFGRLLSEAVRQISFHEAKPILVVQDELGYALERDTGGSAIEYWRKGHVPARQAEVEQLATLICQRVELGREWLERFLRSAGVPQPQKLCDALYPQQPAPALAAPRPQAGLAALHELAPFVAGPPITHCRQFFGRAAELRRIFDGLSRHPLQNIAIIGPHRSGKTSLLHYIKNITVAPPDQLRPGQHAGWLRQPERYRWVFIDFQDVRMCRLDSLLRFMLQALRMAVPEPLNLITFMDVVCEQLTNPAVILLDEIGAALAAPELDLHFWWSLRSLGTNQTRGLLSFILASHEAPDRQASVSGKPSPFFNIFQRLDLGPLGLAEAEELLASSPRPFGADDRAWIVAQSGRHPALLQILSNTLLSAIEHGDGLNGWRSDGLRQIAPYRALLGSPERA